MRATKRRYGRWTMSVSTRSKLVVGSCSVTFLSFAMPVSMLGVMWPDVRERFGQSLGALGVVSLVYGLSRMSTSGSGRVATRRFGIGRVLPRCAGRADRRRPDRRQCELVGDVPPRRRRHRRGLGTARLGRRRRGGHARQRGRRRPHPRVLRGGSDDRPVGRRTRPRLAMVVGRRGRVRRRRRGRRSSAPAPRGPPRRPKPSTPTAVDRQLGPP